MTTKTKTGTRNNENMFFQEGLDENLFVRNRGFGKDIERAFREEEFDAGIGENFC